MIPNLLLALMLLVSSVNLWAAPTITFPREDDIIIRNKVTLLADIYIEGTYTGSPTGIYAKLGVDGTPQEIDGDLVGGTFSGWLRDVPSDRAKLPLKAFNEGRIAEFDRERRCRQAAVFIGQSNNSVRAVEFQVSRYASDATMRASNFLNTNRQHALLVYGSMGTTTATHPRIR